MSSSFFPLFYFSIVVIAAAWLLSALFLVVMPLFWLRSCGTMASPRLVLAAASALSIVLAVASPRSILVAAAKNH